MTKDLLRLVIFDCDGTLVDSQHAIAHCMDHAFAEHGLDCPGLEKTRTIIGLSLPEAIAQLARPAILETTLINAVTNSYKSAFFTLRQSPDFFEPLFPGVVEVIDILDQRGWLSGVATGKARRGLDAVLDRNNLSRRFVTLQTCDNHPSKPHPSMLEAAMLETGVDPRCCAMIGDTTFDMEMGRAAGMLSIGVAWGYHDREKLETAGAHAVIDHFDQLPAILDDLWKPADETA
ncbi:MULTISPECIES: HAD-IA family hydrolase [unclassified Thalassospira]|jgi:phosphoglycolate phosphatase|uniref:HAD-IA family hydrolase n=1 Tax=unclassified Thalassospira TaxID=2648997 RepID=UPI000A1E0EF5|nr:HAD-IA family hydrolase [Thalassospira sp. MCCC 1A01428]OSQ41106.1 haloacid dehalogenase [Thalassospira sp. MCCC 1A01428]